jgi:hypothetical protein
MSGAVTNAASFVADGQKKPRIAVFAGPTATILNSAPLVTSNSIRRSHGLPELTDEWGEALRYDLLRLQRLAKPVTVYVEQFSAHPLEAQSAHLYGPPDGYLDEAGEFHPERASPGDVPVYRVTLRPEDGLFPLPYAARQRDGTAWDGDCSTDGKQPEDCRQPFYPDASRVFEEIDRTGIDEHGGGNLLGAQADYDFIRVVPSGGYPLGLSGAVRTDFGGEDIAPERIWEDYFPYRPPHLRREPPRRLLAQLTNRVQSTLASGDYLGSIWLEGSPFIEETTYWLNLLIDTTTPIATCASPDFPHGSLGAGGDRHIVDAVRYLRSRIWTDAEGRNRVGVVLISAEQLFAAREVQKADARPGGYTTTGGHGGIVGSLGEPGPPVLTYVPVWRHTHTSAVNLTRLPDEVMGVRASGDGLIGVPVSVKRDGMLIGDAIPHVSFVKHARYLSETSSDEASEEVALLAEIKQNLERHPLAGFALEGGAPYGSAGQSMDSALRLATFSGMPVVRTSRGNAEGFVPAERVKLGIAGGNLTVTKARLLLMACLLRFGSLPPAADPAHPTAEETSAVEQALTAYQEVFDSH